MSAKAKAVRVPMEVKWEPAWLTWVGATTACLKALGVKCDRADVAGMSGYAFHLGINKGMCPSGPTILDWGALVSGVHDLGRSTFAFQSRDCHTGKHICDRTRAHCRQALEVARREIEAGRPCVLWGAYVPEFAVAVGIEGDSFIVRSFKECIGQPQPPIPYDKLDAPGGPYVLAFPTATGSARPHADRQALMNAVRTFSSAPWWVACGSAGYDRWIETLKRGDFNVFGNSYNAACYAEGRRFAAEFVGRVAKRNAFAAKPLGEAAKHYGVAAEAMGQVTTLFPFPGGGGEKARDRKVIAKATAVLKKAKAAECRAMSLIGKVAALEWPEA